MSKFHSYYSYSYYVEHVFLMVAKKFQTKCIPSQQYTISNAAT